MTEKQEHLLKLFQELDHICQENELRYVLAEESTLAAVGRAGFAGGRDRNKGLHAKGRLEPAWGDSRERTA